MDIISTEGTTHTSPLKFKVGGATLIFETVEDWKDNFRALILPACEAVRVNRARSEYHSLLGDIFYASLVHAIVSMIDSFVHQKKPMSADEVDLTLSMSSTGVWKEGAELDAIVQVAARFLSLYKGVDPSNKDLKATLLEEFDTVWRVIIDGFLDTHPKLCRNFSESGYLIQALIGPESYSLLTTIRKRVRPRVERRNGTAGSSGTSGMSASTAKQDGN